MREIYKNEGGKVVCYKQMSHWIKIKTKAVTEKHSLFDYSDDGVLTYFIHKNKMYALDQFMRFDFGPGAKNIELEDGITLVAYDVTSAYKPFMIELKSDEYVRLWIVEEVTL